MGRRGGSSSRNASRGTRLARRWRVGRKHRTLVFLAKADSGFQLTPHRAVLDPPTKMQSESETRTVQSPRRPAKMFSGRRQTFLANRDELNMTTSSHT